jgi:transcriptional regulator GlxA family with amidase domain
MSTRSVLICLFDGVQSLDVTGPLEVFAGANQYSGSTTYEIRTASLGGGSIRTSSKLLVGADADLRTLRAPHTLLVPGGEGTRAPDPELVDWVRSTGRSARRVVSVCSGAFVLAEAGLLDGRRATTHWAACETLARRFPLVEVDPEPIFVRDGKFVTSAGVTAGIDLALALVEDDLGRDVALSIARNLVMFLRRPGNQTQFSEQLSAQLAHREPIRDVQRWVADNPAADLSVNALATRANLSPRQFARAFTTEVGVTPGKYVDRLRLETARRLLEDTGDGVAEIAGKCGYGTPESMRRAFLLAVGVGPAEYRRRF